MPLLVISAYMLFASMKKPGYRKELLTDRQLIIMGHVTKRNRVTQAELEKLTGFSRSSLSRYINSIVKKRNAYKGAALNG